MKRGGTSSCSAFLTPGFQLRAPEVEVLEPPTKQVEVYHAWATNHLAIVCCKFLLGARIRGGTFRDLGPMPDTNNPDKVTLDSVEEPVRTNDDFTEGQIRELRQSSPRFREILQTTKDDFNPSPDIPGGLWAVPSDVGQG